jgi:putative glutamine amidotransferase
MAPVIGISAYREQARWGVWDTGAVLLPQHYCAQVAAAGGVPVLLPPLPGVERAVGRLDGLVLSGGADVDPGQYGAGAHQRTYGVRPDRDAAEAALLAAALDQGLPLLGICRGLQVINVARGGTLHQHLPDLVGHTDHGPTPGAYGAHPVRVRPGSKLAEVLGRTEVGGVPTHHHQAIDRLGDGLTAVAWTPDGVIEAVELDAPGSPFALAVQWHPEAGTDPSLFRALVTAASRAVAGLGEPVTAAAAPL